MERDILADVMDDSGDEAQSQVDQQKPLMAGGDLLDVDEVLKPADSDRFEFEIKKFVLQALLEKAQSVVPKKDTMPVLKNFQVEVQPGHLRVVATDLELMVVSTTEMVLVRDPGQAVFPAAKMMEIVREADEGDALISVAEGKAHIEIGRTAWDLKLQSNDGFPPTHDIADVEIFKIDRAQFLGALHSVRYAAAKDTTRPSLMMVDVSNGKMTACDGVRFQQALLGDDFPMSLRIPTGAIDDLVKLLRTTDQGTIGIGESEYYLVFRIGADVFIANKLMAQFPDVENLLLRPALENKHVLLVDRQELVDSIKRVKINSDPETSAIGLVLSQNKLTVRASDKFGNEASEIVDVSWTDGDRQLVVNHLFLMEMLQMYDGKSCKFLIGDDTKSRKSPLLLRDEETGTIGVVQQMVSDWIGYGS